MPASTNPLALPLFISSSTGFAVKPDSMPVYANKLAHACNKLAPLKVDRWDLYRRAEPAAPKHDFAIGVHALHHTSKFALTVVVARCTQAFVCKMLGLLAAPASAFLAVNNVMDHHLVVARVGG